MSLSPRQLRFVEEYVIDLNGKQAAIRAGYSRPGAQQCGSRLLSMPKVKAAVAEAMAARSARTRVTADRVVQEYARMAFADIRQAVRWRIATPEGGKTAYEIELVDSADLDDEAAAAVAEVSQAAGGALRVKMHDKKGALDSLARHLGLFAEKAAAKEEAPAEEDMTERMAALPQETRERLRAAITEVLGE
jgi:phage terminase small subunit